jgi:hypothetical protein
MNNKQLDSLLFKPEFRSLAGGKSFGTLCFLILIYSLALFSMGSSQQVMTYLDQKMNDPFVEGITAVAPARECDEHNLRARLLENDSLKVHYDIKDIRLFAKNYVTIQSPLGRTEVLAGCFDNKNHPLWEMLHSKPELFITKPESCRPFDILSQSGIILSEETFEALGYTNQTLDSLPVTIDWFNDSSTRIPARLPIIGVVKSLPFGIGAAIRSHTWGYITGEFGTLEETTAWFVGNADLGQITGDTLPLSVEVPRGKLYTSGSLRPEMADIERVGTLISFLQVTDTNQVNNLQEEYIIFSMSPTGLSKVRSLNEELRKNKEKYGCDKVGVLMDSVGSSTDSYTSQTLKFEETKIVAKENLVIFKSFAQLLSAALVLITLILIVNYTGAVLRLHINNNKQNLGTLTAFGYPNKTIISLYLRITATILGGAFIVSYLLIWPLGYLGFNVFLNWFNLNERLSDVSFSHIPLTYSIPLFVMLPLVILAWRIQGQLKATPGDLVYDR